MDVVDETYTVQVTAEELDALQQYRAARDGGSAVCDVVERVSEALRKPAIACLFPNWRNGTIIIQIDFENGKVKYVTPTVKGPRMKVGIEI